MRTIEELKIRASAVLTLEGNLRDDLVRIASEKSPSAAYDMGLTTAHNMGRVGGESLAIAKATRWLAMAKRDYGSVEFDRIVKKED